jgi:hypothetical protein
VEDIVDFNPRSHEGSDTGKTYILMLRFKISIHAPTRGATTENAYATFHTKISIHAPTRGATYVSEKIYTYFEISIHAPTRGATATLTNFFFYNQSIFC